MKKSSNCSLWILGMILGLVLFLTPLIMIQSGQGSPSKIIQIIFLFIGCSLFVFSLLMLMNSQIKSGKGAKKYNAELKDERNIIIRYKAGYITNIVMIIFLAVIAFILLLLNYLMPAILLAIALILQSATLLFLSYYFNKRM